MLELQQVNRDVTRISASAHKASTYVRSPSSSARTSRGRSRDTAQKLSSRIQALTERLDAVLVSDMQKYRTRRSVKEVKDRADNL